ncbi:MAG: 3-phosphoglycerate dehydrogenase [Odoribacteraceae bacterium]|jgi:D-3-phosphoglycerate dehydrogenase|nr:3-phosphoglycerate dehydrogenase [Odoribacteraceae bacterium]
MKKVLIATDKPFAPVAVRGIREIVEAEGYKLDLLEKYTSPQELLAAVTDADAMIIRSDKATREVIEAAKKLKVIVRAGAGYDNIDLEACTARDVVAMNTPGQNANAVAELALGLMVYMARGFYNGKSGSELKGKKIGVHAYGNVGQNVGRIARGFGMEVYAFDPYMTDEQIRAAGATPLHSVGELYTTCQYISLHIPATAETKRSINYDLLRQMPAGAVLVNTARKEVIDEEGLARLMDERQDFGYITDIAPDSEAFKKFEGRFYATPKKMGAQTEEANVNAGLAAARQIVNFFKTGDKKFKVN